MALFFLLGTMFSSAFAQSSKCADVRYNTVDLFEVMVEIEGPRGSLRYPAILDTGASQTLVPASIMKGIGYSSHGKETFSTAGGKNSFDSGKVRSLSFLGMKFTNALVYVDNPSPLYQLRVQSICPKKNSQGRITGFGPCDKSPQKETGVIGMSELSQTSFEFKDGVMRVCKGGQ